MVDCIFSLGHAGSDLAGHGQRQRCLQSTRDVRRMGGGLSASARSDHQHIGFTPSYDEVASFSHNGIEEFPGTIRLIRGRTSTRRLVAARMQLLTISACLRCSRKNMLTFSQHARRWSGSARRLNRNPWSPDGGQKRRAPRRAPRREFPQCPTTGHPRPNRLTSAKRQDRKSGVITPAGMAQRGTDVGASRESTTTHRMRVGLGRVKTLLCSAFSHAHGHSRPYEDRRLT